MQKTTSNEFNKIKKELKTNPFKNKKGKVVIMQSPNLLIWGVIFMWLLKSILPEGKLLYGTKTAFLMLLTVWAYQELVEGESLFRRALGLVIIITSFLNIYRLFL